jgi:hypothetical protein
VLLVPVHLEQHSPDYQREADLQTRHHAGEISQLKPGCTPPWVPGCAPCKMPSQIRRPPEKSSARTTSTGHRESFARHSGRCRALCIGKRTRSTWRGADTKCSRGTASWTRPYSGERCARKQTHAHAGSDFGIGN